MQSANGIDLKAFKEKRKRGLAEMVQAGGGLAIMSARFDPNTGDRLAPDMAGIDLKELRQNRDQLAQFLADLDELIAEAEALLRMKSPPE